MPVTLDKTPVEKGTLVITASFFDEEDNAVTPDSLTWSLVDRKENIINGRDSVSVSSLSSSVDIILSGEDLATGDSIGQVSRWIILEATYTSSLASGLPLNEQAEFKISSIRKV